ncbi:hypothetical protein ETAA8_32030 [Anatilimnocola aggregata]|uniref:Uncharacterized protein n=1 Tax=Anatilimnocola aggregata TaxID=2528021 RepID=A0A517YCZ8_9BACT|nr:hypothetical protein [Anatilimnocola aggregata]QDU28110.1 hypothetical protein ETAA8_32030 [Anatilimnocola aggregata]
MTTYFRNWLRCSQYLKVAALAAFGLLTMVALAQACNVPVFRFALERWRADAYRVTVFHEGALSPADKALIVKLEEQQEKSLANVTVRTLDVAELDEPADRDLLKSLPAAKFPQIVMQYPAALKIDVPVWSQPLDSTAVTRLLDSPLRKDLLNRLVDGETAVWLLLESGNAEKDEQAATLLQQQLAKLGKELQLPELTDLPDDNLVAKTPLKLSFSMLRVPRSESESPLVQMLLRSESDLLERSDPMIFPVFGRGRALLPLIGAGITADNIKGSATFLVGACSCEVKDLNPGFDLLLTADWDQLLSKDGTPLPIVSTRQIADGPPEFVPIPTGNKAAVDIGQSEVAAIASDHHIEPATTPRGNSAIYTIIAIFGALVTWIVLVNFNRKKPAAG